MQTQNNSLHLLRYQDLKERNIVPNRTSLKRWQLRDENPFPRPIQLAENSIAWRVTDVLAWLDRCETKRNEIEVAG